VVVWFVLAIFRLAFFDEQLKGLLMNALQTLAAEGPM
jgi:hypothetical protein